MIRTFHILVLVSLAASPGFSQESRPTDSSTAVTTPTFNNVNCPVMGKPVSTKLFVDTDYGRIYVCCKACNKKIQADPAGTYKTAYPTTKKVANTVCPVSGEPVNDKSPTVTIQGHEIAICCDDCSKEVRANSVVVLARLTNPKVVDIGNATCPITGKPVQRNVFCLIGSDLVHLATADAADEVRKEPKKALDKAKEIRAAADRAGGERKPEHRMGGGSAESRPGAR